MGIFQASRGSSRGHPLLPYLFINGIKYNESKYLHGNNDSPSHLLFADDLMILTRAITHDAMYVRNILECFYDWSWQEINFSKPGYFF